MVPVIVLVVILAVIKYSALSYPLGGAACAGCGLVNGVGALRSAVAVSAAGATNASDILVGGSIGMSDFVLPVDCRRPRSIFCFRVHGHSRRI